jgi:hypothetical protein
MVATGHIRATRPAASTTRSHSTLSARAIGVGVRDYEHDRAAIEWAAYDARPAVDAVHLVHAYVPLLLSGCTWDRVTRAQDARHQRAHRVLAQSMQRVRSGRGDLQVEGSVIAGLPDDVLIELSSVVDLVVIGDDSASASDRRRISWRVQDSARCPVVCVPQEYEPRFDARPVTVVAGEDGLPENALQFAAAAAHRRGVGLEISRSWSSLHGDGLGGAGWLADQQEELDAQLADLRLQHPHLAITARIELGDDWLDMLRAGSSLLVTSVYAGSLVRSDHASGHGCPVAIVPDEHFDGE